MNSPGLSGAPGAGRRDLASAFDDRLREPVAVAEMVVCVVEWRRRLQVQRREHLHAFALRDEFVVLDLAALPLGGVAGEQYRNGMKIRAGKSSHPVVRMIAPVSPSISARATMPCLNSSGNVASEASSTPSARRPFQVKATVTQRLSLSDRSQHSPRPTAPFPESPTARPVHPRRRETKEIRIAR